MLKLISEISCLIHPVLFLLSYPSTPFCHLRVIYGNLEFERIRCNLINKMTDEVVGCGWHRHTFYCYVNQW